MRTEHLQYLVDILKTGSINKTAQHFFISQQAVSNSIRQLENELGCCLLNRTATGVSLTHHGLLVADFAQQILTKYTILMEQLQDDLSAVSIDEAPIDIQSASIVLNMSLLDVLDDFSQDHPLNRIRIKENSPENIFDQVLQKKCDLAFITIRYDRFEQFLSLYQDIGLNYLPIFEDTLVVCAANTSLYIEMKQIDTALFAHTRRTLFGFTPTYEYASSKIEPYENSVTVSNDVEFHKKILLQDNRLITLMPLTAYRLFFKSRRFIMRPLSESIHFMHAVLIAPQPRSIALDLVQLIENTLSLPFR